MSAARWVDVIHTETKGRARIPRDALAAHEGLGWVIDTDPPEPVDPTDPVATSTPEDDDGPGAITTTTDTGDAATATDTTTKKG